MDKKILKLLYRSFDYELNKKETQLLKEALKQSEDLRREKDQILIQRQAILESPKPSFKPFFSDLVMRRIESLSKKRNGIDIFYETLLAMFRGFAIISAAILIILLLVNLYMGDALSSGEIFYSSDVAVENLIKMPLF